MSELADRLVTAGHDALAALIPEGSTVAVDTKYVEIVAAAVLREIGTWGEMQKYPVNLFTTLAEQIEPGAISKALEGS